MEKLVELEKRRIADERYDQSQKTPWHNTLMGKIIIGLIIAVPSGACVAYIAYRLGWL